MDYNNKDVIIARATPVGKSALAIIRLSGLSLKNVLAKVFIKKTFQPNMVQLRKIKEIKSKTTIDSCMVVFYKAPKSFTGEDMLEIFCHGNDRIVNKIISEFFHCNVRIAYPGEFSYRAFKNGKIDLMQAESIAEKINQNSEQYGVALQNIEDGNTSKKITALRESVLNIQSVIEHELDFNEEEVTHITYKNIADKFKKIIKEIKIILHVSLYLQKIEGGYNVVFIGVPNAGKSTLFNKLIGTDKAIVTNIKGTTRDALEANINIKGIPITLYDTAGYRNTKNKIESLGVLKTKSVAKNSDIIIMIDEKDPVKVHRALLREVDILKNKKTIFVKSKSDNEKQKNNKGNIISLSCKNDIGINALLTKLLTIIGQDYEKVSASNVALCNMRQISLLEEISLLFNEMLTALNKSIEMDVLASQLKSASDLFDELLGKLTPSDVLNNIFKGFCVGK